MMLATLGLVAILAGSPVPHEPPVTAGAYAQDNNVDVLIREHLRSPGAGMQQASAPKTLTSYQPVCVTEGDELVSGGRCARANSMCRAGAVPMWVVTAAAVPATRAEDWVNTGRVVCRGAGDEGGAAVVLSAAQFRRLPIPPAEIRAQPDPADRPTLVGVETNLLTTQRVEELTTTVLGQRVRVRATPTSYHWRYGDGGELTTEDPGAAYPSAMPTAHVFREKGSFAVRLATTFSGEYSVAGGPWTPVDGTAQVEGPTVTVRVVEARARLVS